MNQIEERLNHLGYQLPATPKVFGAYVPALRYQETVYVSGQLPIQEGELRFQGRLGEDVEVSAGSAAAALCFVNALGALVHLGVPLTAVRQVIRLTGHVQCTQDFKQQPQVLDGASQLAHDLFGTKGVHTRAALGAFALPLQAAVELEVLFAVEG